MKDLKKWQDRLSKAKSAYQSEIDRMDERDAYYHGTRESRRNPNTGQKVTQLSTNVRNIVYELIESQVDSTIPMPRVTAIHAEDKDLAKAIESILRNEIVTQQFSSQNDMQERTVPIQGSGFFEVDWDSNSGTHCTLGDIKVSTLHPKQIIPQPGVYEIKNMDYIFVLVSRTKASVERQYDIELTTDTEDDPGVRGADSSTVDDIVTQNIVYYRNKDGGVGRFSWVGDQIVEDFDDYQARRLERCKYCGTVKTGPVCPECGGKKFVEGAEEYEELTADITLPDGKIVPQYGDEKEIPVTDEKGNSLFDEDGAEMMQVVTEVTKIPYYKPKKYPIVARRNIAQYGAFLGTSDVDVIADQQDTIKKLGAKIDEKCLKGGSFVTLPQGVNVDTSNKEFKILRIKSPAEQALIGVINCQPDCSRDMNVLEQNYQWSKSTLGITDSFQGKYDSSATSGTAKQFAANQSAGRLDSKRKQKNSAYAELYELMFQYLLAYADQPIPYRTKDDQGNDQWAHFDRWAFLRQDDAGEFYWDDEFIFTIDTSATLANDRTQLWNMVDVKYQAGGYGPIGDIDSAITMWKQLENLDYPMAGETVKDLEARKQEAMTNAMPQMQNAAGDSIM